MNSTPELSAAFVRSVLSYDPEMGVFVWIGKTGQSTRLGTVAGRTDKRGYVGINIKNRKYAGHHLAWLHVHGEWPAVGMVVDHIDRNPGNNRIANLRVVSQSENCQNRDPMAFLKEGCMRGVTRHKGTGRWQAVIVVAGKNRYIGLFPTQQLAADAYQRARASL